MIPAFTSGSARETTACLDVAMAVGYVEALDDKMLDGLDWVRPDA
jgi:hypothetical protein